MSTRRQLLKRLGASAAVCSTGAFAVAQVSQFVEERTNPNPPWWLFSLKSEGKNLGRGWHLDSLSSVNRGASVLSLKKENGEQARVHICAHNGNPKGLTHTAFLDFILMDGGKGNQPTDEDLGCALIGLTRRVLIRELQMDTANLHYAQKALSHLQTHQDRLILYKEEGLT